MASLRAYQLVVVLLQHSRLLLTTQDGTTTLSPLAQVRRNVHLLKSLLWGIKALFYLCYTKSSCVQSCFTSTIPNVLMFIVLFFFPLSGSGRAQEGGFHGGVCVPDWRGDALPECLRRCLHCSVPNSVLRPRVQHTLTLAQRLSREVLFRICT